MPAQDESRRRGAPRTEDSSPTAAAAQMPAGRAPGSGTDADQGSFSTSCLLRLLASPLDAAGHNLIMERNFIAGLCFRYETMVSPYDEAVSFQDQECSA